MPRRRVNAIDIGSFKLGSLCRVAAVVSLPLRAIRGRDHEYRCQEYVAAEFIIHTRHLANRYTTANGKANFLYLRPRSVRMLILRGQHVRPPRALSRPLLSTNFTDTDHQIRARRRARWVAGGFSHRRFRALERYRQPAQRAGSQGPRRDLRAPRPSGLSCQKKAEAVSLSAHSR